MAYVEDIKNVVKKFSPSERKEIFKAFDKLRRMINVEESYGTPFERIFNNDAIKYDILGKNFYTFKSQGRDKAQIRILYKFVRTENEYDLELHMVKIKRRNDKDYMKDFADYVEHYA